MRRALRIGLLTTALLVAGGSSAGAAFAPGCINPADSALNQYCETVPGAVGGQPPRAGTPALATMLPARVARAIELSTGAPGRARRALLRLPAPAGNNPQSIASSAVAAGGAGFPLWLVLVMVATATAMAALAFTDRRRRQRRLRTQASA
jgi:hypothetical protein